ncbi:MAG: hypothetical protein CME65_08260 [Halobacteriovoraceae bacterium]|nr:hypothetical protein [Halobacteriovoraceae bacterium]
MAKFNDEDLKDISEKVRDLSSALNGMAALFESQSRQACITPEDFYGVGQVLRQFSRVLEGLEDRLRGSFRK